MSGDERADGTPDTTSDAAAGPDAAADTTPDAADPDTDVPAPATEPDGPSRRLLLGAGAGIGVVVAAGLGGGAALLWPRTRPAAPVAPPAELLAAVAVERALIADLDATTGGSATVRRGIVQARADHAAHLRVLLRALARYDRKGAGASAAPAARGTARSAAQLAAAERSAARSGARRAAAVDGALAPLLASISACEAGHVRLLA